MLSSTIFISYSHEDVFALDLLKKAFDSIEDYEKPIILSDQSIRGGEKWGNAIEEMLMSADLIILVVSDNFFESQYIEEKELPLVLQRLDNPDDNVFVYPILWNKPKKVDNLEKILAISQARPTPETPLKRLSTEERKRQMDIMSSEISEYCETSYFKKINADSINLKHNSEHDIDIDIALFHRDWDHYRAEFRISYRNNLQDGFVLPYGVCLRREEIMRLQKEPQELGKILGEVLFPDFSPESLRDKGIEKSPQAILEYALASVKKKADHSYVHLQISVSPDAQQLHDICWEYIVNPVSSTPLVQNPHIVFSRYISGYDENWRESYLRKKPSNTKQLSAISYVSKPQNIVDNKSVLRQVYPWQEGYCALEIKQKNAINESPLWQKEYQFSANCMVSLVNRIRPYYHCTKNDLNQFSNELQENPIDFLHIQCKCRKKYDKGKTIYEVLFDSGDGQEDVYDIGEVSQVFMGLRSPPRIVILSYPQVRKTKECDVREQKSVLTKLGTLINKTGVPAVIIISGINAPNHNQEFLSKFFSYLWTVDNTDIAFSEARRQVSGQSWHWCDPILLTRMRSSRIWYKPGLQGEASDISSAWSGLIGSVKNKTFLPVIGSGITKTIAGSNKEFARRCAFDYGYPMEYYNRINLPQVIQYLQSTYDIHGWRKKLENTLKELILERNSDRIDSSVKNLSISELFIKLGKLQRKDVEETGSKCEQTLDAYTILSSTDLNVPVFLVSNLNGILQDALLDSNRDPIQINLATEIYNDTVENNFSEPSISNPWVVNLFGSLDSLENAVLTESQFFHFLLEFDRANNTSMIIDRIKRSLSSSSVVFLGFKPDQWSFKILFHIWNNMAGGRLTNLRSQHTQIAVQIDPDDDFTIDPHGAKEYLKSLYKNMGVGVSIYWGTSEDFLNELYKKVNHCDDD